MGKPLLKAVTAVSAALILAACSEAPKTTGADTAATEAKKEPPKPPEAVAAQTAFFEMYKPARTWAPDLLVLSLVSNDLKSVKSAEGKYPMWTAVFVSPSKHEARTFFYSVADDGTTVHKGVTIGGSQAWSGATPKSRPFQTTDFVVNSDAAYKTAAEKAGKWLEEHKDKAAQFYLGSSDKFPAPVWFIVWGDSKAGFAVYVNSITGTVVK